MRWVRRIIVLGLLVATWWIGWEFVTRNQQPVSVHYVVGAVPETSLWKVVLGSFATGAGLVAAFAAWSSARYGLVNRRYRKALSGLEAEIHQLRNLPLAPDPDEPAELAPSGPSARSATARNA